MSAEHLHKLDPHQRDLLRDGLLLPVMEMFYSIQGEGYNTGKAAAFLRIGGCDVGCHWCDVKESWNAELHPLTSLSDIVARVSSFPSRAVVITGGEPLMYNLNPLCRALKQAGMTLFLETSGAYPISGQFDWICLSPKINAPPLAELLLMADELKVIVSHEADLKRAEEYAALVKGKCMLMLQPEWSQYKQMISIITDYVQQHPKWQVSLQSHKFMHIP